MSQFHVVVIEALVIAFVWDLARAYVFSSIDPHRRLLEWIEVPRTWPGLYGMTGLIVAASILFMLYLFWPVVAWRYCKDNPQEKSERSFALW